MELLIAGQSYSFISLPTFDDALESGGGTVSFDVRGDVPDPDDLPVVVKSGRQKIFTGIYNSLRVDCSGPRKSTLTCESNFNLTRTRILFGRFEGEATDVLQRLVLACRLEQLLGLPASPVSTRVSLALNGEFLNEALDLFKQQIGGDWRVRMADGALEVFTPESAALAPFDVGLPQNLCRPETWCQQVSYEVKPGFYSNVIVAGKNTQLFYADRKPFAVVPAKIDISEAAYPLGSTQRQFPLYKGPTRILEAKLDLLSNSTPLFNGPRCLAFDGSGNLYIADSGNYRIRKVDSITGFLSTLAGTGTNGHSGDDGPAAEATIYGSFYLTGMQADDYGLYFCGLETSAGEPSTWFPAVRRIDLYNSVPDERGKIFRFIGNYTAGDSGDGGDPLAAEIDYPRGIASLSGGNLVLATGSAAINTTGNLRRTTAAPSINRIVDDNTFYHGFVFDGSHLVGWQDANDLVRYDVDGSNRTVIGTATGLAANNVAFDPASTDYFFFGFDPINNVYKIYRMDTSGTVTYYAGADTEGYFGDGGPATDAKFRLNPQTSNELIYFAEGLYIADVGNSVVRKINLATGIISLFAGTPEQFGFDGDGGPAVF